MWLGKPKIFTSVENFTDFWPKRSLETNFTIILKPQKPKNSRLGLTVCFYSMIYYWISSLYGKFFFSNKPLWLIQKLKILWRLEMRKTSILSKDSQSNQLQRVHNLFKYIMFFSLLCLSIIIVWKFAVSQECNDKDSNYFHCSSDSKYLRITDLDQS